MVFENCPELSTHLVSWERQVSCVTAACMPCGRRSCGCWLHRGACRRPAFGCPSTKRPHPSVSISTPTLCVSLHPLPHKTLSYPNQQDDIEAIMEHFKAFKKNVPVMGAILLDQDMQRVLLVKGWKNSACWGFPRGKIHKNETDAQCAVREVSGCSGCCVGSGLCSWFRL